MSSNSDTVLLAFLRDYSGKLHVREIGRLVKMNRQTASQTLKSMEQKRILNSEISGKQKKYYLNRGLVAKLHVINAENLKRIEICEKKPVIARLPQYIETKNIFLLFGSYAKDTERNNSDIYVAIIGEKK